MSKRILWQQVEVSRSDIHGCDVFPLPLTIMEKFFIWDQSIQYPKRFQIIVECEGTINEEAWLQALKIAVARHPMLVANIDGNDQRWSLDGQLYFKVGFVDWRHKSDDCNVATVARWISEAAVTENSQIPQTNLCVAVIHLANRMFLAFDVYHPCCDGLGMRIFIEDATSGYNSLVSTDGVEPRWKKLDAELLKKRHECPEPRVKDETRKTSIKEKISNAWHFHVLTPKPIAPTTQAAQAPSLDFKMFEIDMDEVDSLRNSMVNRSIQINEWAISCLMIQIQNWQRKNGGNSERIRIMLPIDLRVWDDLRLPACNKIGFAFLVNDSKTTMKADNVVDDVRRQLEWIRKLCIGSDFVRIFEPFSRLGWFVRWMMKRTKCFSTAVVTNLGDVTARQRKGRTESSKQSSAGDLRLLGIYGWPPLRPGTQCGIGICRYDKKLSLSAVFDRAAFTAEQSDEFFEEYIKLFRTLSC